VSDEFDQRNEAVIGRAAADDELRRLTTEWFLAASRYEYSYHFKWLGRPIIQFPQDILALQEIIWRVRPRVVVETGVARGGSLVFYASLLDLMGGDAFAVGIDIDIRPKNRSEIERHPLMKRIRLIEGSSVDPEVVQQVRNLVAGREPVMIVLDSSHTHEHVLAELRQYAPLVSRDSYLVVLDTIIERMPRAFSDGRPWGPGNSPMTAVAEFLKTTDRFEVDTEIDNKLLITVAPEGYLRCVKD
jgi:cephalosporin hydroxylase